MPETVTLYRPVGPCELELIKKYDWTVFPPRLVGQTIFYPVLNEEYAVQIARNWNAPISGSGFIAKFLIDKKYIEKYVVHKVGGYIHQELWIPAEELDEFNKHIIGKIELVSEFYQEMEK